MSLGSVPLKRSPGETVSVSMLGHGVGLMTLEGQGAAGAELPVLPGGLGPRRGPELKAESWVSADWAFTRMRRQL